MSNLFPGLVNAIFDAAAAGDNKRAVALQQEANELRHLTGTGIPVAFYHAAIKYRWGIDIGLPRRPLKPLDAQAEARVRATLDRFRHLT
jgi:dihydrodipicolinate synthase/N-acetylneuraminate lyase